MSVQRIKGSYKGAHWRMEKGDRRPRREYETVCLLLLPSRWSEEEIAAQIFCRASERGVDDLNLASETMAAISLSGEVFGGDSCPL